MALAKVEVNLNAITGDQLVRVRLDHFPEPPTAGMAFTAFDPDDEIEGPARVVAVHESSGLATVAVAWELLRDLQ